MTESTPGALIAAAHIVVAREGWAGATSRAIACQAGVNLALINYHFGSKQSLLVAALEVAVGQLEAAPMSDEYPPLIAAMLAGARLADDPSARVVLAACVEATRDASLAIVVRGLLGDLRNTVRVMLGSRAEPGLVTLLAATLDGLLLHCAIDPDTDVRAAALALSRVLDLR